MEACFQLLRASQRAPVPAVHTGCRCLPMPGSQAGPGDPAIPMVPTDIHQPDRVLNSSMHVVNSAGVQQLLHDEKGVLLQDFGVRRLQTHVRSPDRTRSLVEYVFTASLCYLTTRVEVLVYAQVLYFMNNSKYALSPCRPTLHVFSHAKNKFAGRFILFLLLDLWDKLTPGFLRPL